MTAALNTGVALSRGRYLARLDADDVAMPQRLARQVARLEGEAGFGLSIYGFANGVGGTKFAAYALPGGFGPE